MAKNDIFESLLGSARELEELIENPAQLLGVFSQDMESLAYANLRKSRDARDRKAVVEIHKTRINGFDVIVVRPPEVQKQFKVNKKDLTPGRYFEIHGPGGRVKVTTNVDVMTKAKKQGIHVQTKYKSEDGKTPIGAGVYGAGKEEDRIIGPLSKKQIIDSKSPEYQNSVVKFNNLMAQKLEAIFGRAS